MSPVLPWSDIIPITCSCYHYIIIFLFGEVFTKKSIVSFKMLILVAAVVFFFILLITASVCFFLITSLTISAKY